MDISMPRMDGLQANRAIRRDVPESDVIIVSQHDPAIVSGQAAAVEASAYVAKADLARDLFPAVESVFAARNGNGAGKVRDPEARLKEELQVVSQREQAERASGLLAAIVDSSDDAIISKNLDGTITSWNKGAERMFGYSAEEAVGQHITLIIPQDRLNEETHILEKLRRGERIEHFETVRKSKYGKLLDISVSISPVKDTSGRVVG